MLGWLPRGTHQWEKFVTPGELTDAIEAGGLAVADTRGVSTVFSFVEESADHRLFIAAALVEDGVIRHVHRKLFLPTYGLFDERRFFAAGDLLRAVPSELGIGIGLAVCEDFWHLAVPQLLALDGAQILINVSSSPGRDLASTNEVGLGTAYSLVAGLLLGYLVIRADSFLSGARGRRARRAEEASAHRPEPGRSHALL